MPRSSLLVAPALVALALAVPAPVNAGEPGAVPLWQAADDGLVTVKVREVSGYTQVALEIANVSTGTLAIDVNGSYLVPMKHGEDDPGTQPLGLGVLAEGDHQTDRSVVSIAAGAHAKCAVLTVCMNHGASSPSASTHFRLARTSAPEATRLALADWKANTSTIQSEVQGAVWGGGRPDPHGRAGTDARRRPASPVVPAPIALASMDLPDGTRMVAVVGGDVYALTEDGVLETATPDSEWLELAKGVKDFVADHASIHALFARAVSRYDVFGAGRWSDEVKVEGAERLLWAGGGAALLGGPDGVRLVDPAAETRNFGAAGAASASGEGGVVLAASQGGTTELTRIAATGSGILVTSSSVAAVVSAAVPAGRAVFALTREGKLLEIEDGATRELGSARALFPGKDAALVLTASGLVVRTASGVARYPAPSLRNVVADAANGEVHSWEGTALERLDESASRWVPVHFKR